MATAGVAGFNIPGSSDPKGVAANFCDVTYSSNGTPKETNPPVPPPKAPNSSPVTQKDGSSLPKTVQGVISETTTDLNNLFPAHGCSIKLPALFKKLQVDGELLPQINAQRLQDFATWLGVQVNPLIEAIKSAVKAIKAKIKQIEVYVKWLKKQIKTIQEWISATQELIAFMMTLPAKLAQLVTNCLTALQNNLTTMIQKSVDAVTHLSGTNEKSQSGTTEGTQLPSTADFPNVPGIDEVTIG